MRVINLYKLISLIKNFSNLIDLIRFNQVSIKKIKIKHQVSSNHRTNSTKWEL